MKYETKGRNGRSILRKISIDGKKGSGSITLRDGTMFSISKPTNDTLLFEAMNRPYIETGAAIYIAKSIFMLFPRIKMFEFNSNETRIELSREEIKETMQD